MGTVHIFATQDNQQSRRVRYFPSSKVSGDHDGMNSNKTRVVLADDHVRIRAGIRNLLNNTQDIVVVGEADNGLEALQLVETLEPDVLLLDIEMPEMNGNEVAAILTANDSSVRILALSAHDDSQYIIGMLENGASGYITKEEVPDILISAVRSIARGEKGWISQRLEKKIAARKATRPSQATLTQRELEILHSLADQKSYQEIATDLGIDIALVVRHVERLCVKISARSPDQLASTARKEGII
jgi:DNA-binding NarL/FixJ family response regulator